MAGKLACIRMQPSHTLLRREIGEGGAPMVRTEMDSGGPGARDGRAAPPTVHGPGGRTSTRAGAPGQVPGRGGGVSREDEDGVVRLKIVVSKRQLRQMVLSMGGRGGYNRAASPPPSLAQAMEQLLHVLRRRHVIRRAASGSGKALRRPWSPALQSIPEEM